MQGPQSIFLIEEAETNPESKSHKKYGYTYTMWASSFMIIAGLNEPGWLELYINLCFKAASRHSVLIL